MQSIAQFFRYAAHRAPLRASPPLSSVATSARVFSSARSLRQEQPPSNEGNALDAVAGLFRSTADATPPSRSEPPYKKFTESDFVQPRDFSRGARTDTGRRRGPKRWLLGPGRAESEKNDIFRQLDIDPLHEVFNSHLLSHYVTDMGRIQKRSETQLTWRSHRKLGKAIRRARQMGIVPIYSRRVLTAENAWRTFKSYKRS